MLLVTLGLLLFLDVATFKSTAALYPHGGWDASAIWNLRARFLASGSGWKDGFREVISWSHPDYPLLVPAFITTWWKVLGRETQAVPMALACSFTFAIAALMASSIAILRGTTQGLLAGVAVAATPVLYVQGAMQCADVPLAFFVLSTLAAMAIAEQFVEPGYDVLAGASAALAGWTKNEGLLWFVAFLLARIMIRRMRPLWPVVAGAAPVLAVILLFKARVATSSDIFGAAGRAGMAARIVDPGRYALILHESIRHAWEFGPLLVSPFLILAAYLVVVRIERDGRNRSARRAAVLALLLAAGGYFVVYVVHPNPLAWELRSSLERLMLQLWPGVVFTVFLAARTLKPETSAQPSIESSVAAPVAVEGPVPTIESRTT
jgi:Dolichyl-phosphate-mannose-protein mannosyltransferase